MSSVNVNVSGTWHSATPWVNVSGTWHKLVSAWANVAGTWHQVFAGGITLFTGTNGGFVGFRSTPTPTFGTLTPTALDATPHTIIALEDSASLLFIKVSGFGSDPGSTWLTSMTLNGGTRLGTTATYSFATGVATWQWTTTLSLANATSYPGTIVHL